MFGSRLMWSQTVLIWLCVCFLTISECQDWVVDDGGCRTPNNEIGDCKPILQCDPLTKFLRAAKRPLSQELIRYLNSFTCSYDSHQVWVCCPSGPVFFEGEGGSEPADEGPPDVSQHRNYHLLPRECGYLDSGDRILGGVNARLNEFPWMALLSYKTRRGPDFRCGGTIINERYILTAAHCLHNLRYPLLGVRVGEHNIRKKIDCETMNNIEKCNGPVQDLAIEDILIHPGYNETVFQHDIGLIRVTRMNLTVASARPVCLPVETARGKDFDGQRVTVTGWGVSNETGSSSSILQKVQLPIVSLAECRKVYEAVSQAVVTKRQLCAGGVKKKDSCSGDSGGPMHSPAYVNEDLRYVQEGVVSFGPATCGSEGFPAVYTRVDYYMDWLLDVMKP